MTKQKQRRIAAALAAVMPALLIAAGWLFLAPDAPADAVLRPAAATEAEPFRLDLNDATAEELMCLPGIGPALAENILSRRAELGAFRAREDVLSVSGIGEATYEAIAPYITY